jgi:hypothetical protein
MLMGRVLAAMAGRKVTLVELGEYTPEQDIASSHVSIPHSLGVVPDFVYAFADGIDIASGVGNRVIVHAVSGRANCAQHNTTGVGTYFSTNNNGGLVINNEYVNYTKFCDATTFKIPYYNSGDTLKGGVKYRYAIGKFSDD